MRLKESYPHPCYPAAGVGPAQYIFWLISFLIAYSDYAELTLIAIIIPYLRCEWNLSKEFEATITISIFLIYAASKLPGLVKIRCTLRCTVHTGFNVDT